ncbi:MBL fold metallo-hydrolase [Actibacterium sp. XHP0104]|uniref:MBL fold metallo-hydrolase n=1 Tax=Actibacterium sp. XHP0104 TaxID=2984335 RepID=UPI0021E833F7|nr:MBL fold metallo-hydrolase [Actibacterium sp. XHP0104]MCV2882523.1 MBL fold metallo-hydrolase [Actibacterium sp. XHP0104]
MARMHFTILGCGSSGGVPRLGGHWGDCDPEDPRNVRTRCSLLVEREDEDGVTRILIDTTPDMRAQLLRAGVGELDAVVFTHSHADHVHGIDDLRQIVFNMRARLPVWADGATQDALYSRFGYAFTQPEGSPYPPILDMHTIKGDVVVTGAGGTVRLTPFRVNHGSIDALGFRVGDVAYLPDVAEMYDESWPKLEGLDLLILDALRRTPHPTHLHLDKALDWISRLAPARAVLTNMHIDLDYATVEAETPDHVTPAYDGLTLSFDL